MKTLVLSLIYLSLSFRSPSTPQTGVPYDWEFAGGLKGESVAAEFVRERELGRNHYGVEYRSSAGVYNFSVNKELFKRTARDIDSQKVSVSWPRDKWYGVGTVSAFDRWRDYEQRLLGELKYEGLYAAAETHFDGLDSAEFGFRRVVWKSQTLSVFHVELEPLLSYRVERDQEFWQAKVRLVFGI